MCQEYIKIKPKRSLLWAVDQEILTHLFVASFQTSPIVGVQKMFVKFDK